MAPNENVSLNEGKRPASPGYCGAESGEGQGANVVPQAIRMIA